MRVCLCARRCVLCMCVYARACVCTRVHARLFMRACVCALLPHKICSGVRGIEAGFAEAGVRMCCC